MIRKYRYFWVLMSVLLGACQEDVTDIPSSQITIKAQILEDQTRTAMSTQDGTRYHVLWSAGEQIVIGQTGDFKTFNLTSGQSETVAQFTGDSPSKVYGDYYAAVYPTENASAGIDGDYIVIGNRLNNEQTYTSETFEKDLAPMTAVSTDGLLYQFYNLYSVIQLPITGSGTLRKMELVGNNSEKVAGDIEMCYSKTDGMPVASSVEADNGCMLRRGTSLKDKITLSFGTDGLTLDETTPVVVNIVVLPGTFTGGFKLYIWDKANDEVLIKETTESVTVKRSYVKRMKPFDYKTAEPLEFDPDVEPWNEDGGELLEP